jgi:hypothetical protein
VKIKIKRLVLYRSSERDSALSGARVIVSIQQGCREMRIVTRPVHVPQPSVRPAARSGSFALDPTASYTRESFSWS